MLQVLECLWMCVEFCFLRKCLWHSYSHSITKSTVRRLAIGQRIEKRDATTAQLSPAHFARAILKVSYSQ